MGGGFKYNSVKIKDTHHRKSIHHLKQERLGLGMATPLSMHDVESQRLRQRAVRSVYYVSNQAKLSSTAWLWNELTEET